ncbi:MAG: OmpH family outer membrane protein [Pirellulales bacterium]
MDRQSRSAWPLIAVGLICTVLGYLFAVPMSRAKESSRGRTAVADAFRAATIDMALLYKSDPKFIRQREELTASIRTAEDAVRAKGASLDSRKRLLQKMAPGSDTFNRLKSEIEIDTALLQTSVQEQKNALSAREADIYWQCHQEMSKVIEDYCEHHGIQMVVRTTNDPIDPANPQSVMQGLNRQVVYDKGIDITQAIVEQLKSLPDRQPAE